jgi:hypothetical protein
VNTSRLLQTHKRKAMAAIRTFFLVVVSAILLSGTSGYSIDVLAGDRHCFVVKAAAGVPITGSFEVIHPDANFITVSVTGPKGFLHYEKVPKNRLKEGADAGKEDEEDSSEGFFSFDAEIEGDHTMCLENGNELENDGEPRLIAFNFRATPEGEQDYQFVGLQSEIADLKEGLELLKDHQSYMNQREDVHNDTLKSIHNKVLWWTVLEVVIVIALSIWQITYIRRFFETKRKM